jgi:hypothetical protein
VRRAVGCCERSRVRFDTFDASVCRGSSEGSVGGECRGEAAQTGDRLADALETASATDTSTSGVRSVLLLISVRPSVPTFQFENQWTDFI